MKRYSLTVLLALFAFTALVPAQPLRGSYFFETSLLRSKLNPAFAPQADIYISVPVIGNASAGILSNVGLGNFLFADGDKNYTFLNDRVDANTFYAKLPQEDPWLSARFDTDLLGGGYRLNDAIYLTAGLSVSGWGHAEIPRELLRFAKTGRSGNDQSWHIEDLKALFMSYATLSAGCSYDFSEWVQGLYAGARVKLMTGLYAAAGTIHSINISMTDDRFSAATNGAGNLAGITYDPDNGFRSDGLKLRGFGATVDLGVEYRLSFDGFINGLNLSASILNLGRLSYGETPKIVANGAASFNGFTGLGADFDFQSELDQVLEDFSSLTNLSVSGSSKLDFIMPEYHVGIEVPFYNQMLSTGLLYSYYLGKSLLTLAFNATPLDWLNLSANYTFGPAGTFGFYAEYIPKKYVGFFLGFEKAAWKTNKHLLGIRNFTESLCLGLNVLL